MRNTPGRSPTQNRRDSRGGRAEFTDFSNCVSLLQWFQVLKQRLPIDSPPAALRRSPRFEAAFLDPAQHRDWRAPRDPRRARWRLDQYTLTLPSGILIGRDLP